MFFHSSAIMKWNLIFKNFMFAIVSAAVLCVWAKVGAGQTWWHQTILILSLGKDQKGSFEEDVDKIQSEKNKKFFFAFVNVCLTDEINFIQNAAGKKRCNRIFLSEKRQFPGRLCVLWEHVLVSGEALCQQLVYTQIHNDRHERAASLRDPHSWINWG